MASLRQARLQMRRLRLSDDPMQIQEQSLSSKIMSYFRFLNDIMGRQIRKSLFFHYSETINTFLPELVV